MMKWVIISFFLVISCGGSITKDKTIVPGAELTVKYLKLLEGKKVGIVANQTSMVGNRHLVDTLIKLGVDLITIFSLEHGFRGTADRGRTIGSYEDPLTGLPVISLYGARKKPSPEEMNELDILLFDIQDVGVRFYTYISSLQRVMEACAEADLPLIIFDRPNPNGYYIDGPVLDTTYRSFVGLQQIPVVYGMTIGEYAMMLNGEGLLDNGVACNLSVIKCEGYNHQSRYTLPVKPSPNLPNQTAILLYPSLCFFEGTPISVGRGTEFPFQVIGHPDLPETGFSFTPASLEGATEPLLKGIKCNGYDLGIETDPDDLAIDQLNLSLLIKIYNDYPDKENYFTPYFNLLTGNNILQQQIRSGMSEKEIRLSWQKDLENFKLTRAKYLLYD